MENLIIDPEIDKAHRIYLIHISHPPLFIRVFEGGGGDCVRSALRLLNKGRRLIIKFLCRLRLIQQWLTVR